MIYSLNARDNVKLQMLKQTVGLSAKEMFEIINDDFSVMKSVLIEKGITYEKLRSVLNPPHKSNRKEIVLCFNIAKIEECWYGNTIMKQILPYINKKRNHAIFQGDFCVRPEINVYAFKCLYENISRIRTLMPRNCQQYFLVYINNIIDEEIKELTKALEVMEGFVGYGDMTYANPLKDLLAYYLGQCCIQIGNKVLLSHEDDRSNSENINLIGYDYEKFGFSYFSIQSYYYINYLEYKIESRMVDKSDLLFSLNVISEKIEDFNSYKIVLEPEKFNYIKNKNLVLVESTGIDKMQVEEFKEFLSEKIKLSYIYNLEINDHKVAKFNTIVECSTSARETVRLLVAFAYNTDDRTLRLLSLF